MRPVAQGFYRFELSRPDSSRSASAAKISIVSKIDGKIIEMVTPVENAVTSTVIRVEYDGILELRPNQDDLLASLKFRFWIEFSLDLPIASIEAREATSVIAGRMGIWALNRSLERLLYESGIAGVRLPDGELKTEIPVVARMPEHAG
jgi:hypothetical protein